MNEDGTIITTPGVDEFIDDYKQDVYARWILNHYRLPAALKCAFDRFMAPYKLFCTYRGKRYRCTFASRLGQVCLNSDHSRDHGYDVRVSPYDCTDWNHTP